MTGMKFGIAIADENPSESVRLGLLGEKYNFDSLWITDHFVEPTLGSRVDPWVILSAIGVQTENIFLSTGVTDTFRCHPSRLAQTVATLDELTKGRAGVGIGAGERMNLEPFGIKWEKSSLRAERLKETIEVLKILWRATREEVGNYNGKYFKLRDAFLDQQPLQSPHPPIYVGAFGPKLLRLVGKLADGWYPWVNSPATYAKRLKEIESGAKEADRDLEELDLTAFLYVVLSDDQEEKKKYTKRLKRILLRERLALTLLGHDVKVPIETSLQYVVAQPAKKKSSDQLDYDKAAEEIPDDLAREFIAMGTTEECIETIDAFIHAGAKHIVIRPLGDREHVLQEFNRAIMVYFRK